MRKLLSLFVLLLLLSAAFFPFVFSGNKNLLFGSPYCDSYAYYIWHNLGFSFWDPYLYAGTPHFGRIAMFYFPGYIFAWLPANLCINFGVVLHICLIVIFAYLYFKELTGSINAAVIGALTFSFSSVVVLHAYAGHLSNIYSLPWLPLTFFFILRFHRTRRMSWLVFSSLSLAVQILAGHPQYSIYSFFAYTAYFVFLEKKRFIFYWVLFLAAGVLFAGIELLSVLDLIKGTVRTGADYNFVASFYFPPENLLTLVLPGFWGDLKNFLYWGRWNYWEMTLYIGVLPLFFALVALLKRKNTQGYFFLFLCAASLITAFGGTTFLFPFLYKYVPTFNLFRGISKFIFITAFALSALCAQGAAFLEEEKERVFARRYAVGIAVLCGILLFFSVAAVTARLNLDFWKKAVTLLLGPSSQALFAAIGPLKLQGFLAASSACLSLSGIRLFVLVLVSAVFFVVVFRQKRPPGAGNNMLNLLAAAVIAFDLWTYGFYYSSTFLDIRGFSLDKGAVAFLQKDKEPYRIATDCFFNEGLPYSLENVGGNEGNMLADFSGFLREGKDTSSGFALSIEKYSTGLNLLNVKYLIYPSSSESQGAGLEPVWNNGRFTIYLNKNYLPRAWVVNDVVVEPDRGKTAKMLLSGALDLSHTAVLEKGAPVSFSGPGEYKIEWLERSRHRLSLKISCRRDCFLVLSEIYYPNWHAYLDGKEAEVLRADYLLRGVFVPEGEHTLEMRFQFLKGFFRHNLAGRL
ncbi:MAG: hypothetical protein WBE75_01780 [Candidatus Omnitrophota bacterium]